MADKKFIAAIKKSRRLIAQADRYPKIELPSGQCPLDKVSVGKFCIYVRPIQMKVFPFYMTPDKLCYLLFLSILLEQYGLFPKIHKVAVLTSFVTSKKFQKFLNNGMPSLSQARWEKKPKLGIIISDANLLEQREFNYKLLDRVARKYELFQKGRTGLDLKNDNTINGYLVDVDYLWYSKKKHVIEAITKLQEVARIKIKPKLPG